MELLTEIDQTLALLEAEIPASLAKPENERLEQRLELELRRYFKQLDDAMSMEGLERIYYKNVKME